MAKNTKEKIIIVNSNDEIIGSKLRGTLIDDQDIYRVAALWLNNSQGDILLAQRHHSKKNDPGKWGPAVAGTVEEGETYESNIIKEAQEEIGLINIKPEIGPKIMIEGERRYFTQWYRLVIDKDIKDFKIQENEVEALQWFSLKELTEELKNNPDKFLKRMGKYLQLFS